MATKLESGKQKAGSGKENEVSTRPTDGAVRFLTREELAEALKISLSTLDRMVAGGEIPVVRLHGRVVRFFLPDVVRHLTATALISKRGCARKAEMLRPTGSRVESGEGREEKNTSTLSPKAERGLRA